MRKVWLIALMLVAMFMLVVPVIYAQDVPFPCGGLSESDCADLQMYTEANASLDSAAVDLAIDLTVTEGDESLVFNVTGTGAFTGGSALAAMATTDPAAMASMANPQMISDILKAFGTELNLTIAFPEAVLESNENVPETLDLQIKLVDGVGYINFDTLTAIPNLPLEGWVGLDLAAVASQSMAMMGDMSTMPGMDMAGNAELMAQFTDPEFLNSFLRIDRAMDIPATFRYSFDFGALMQSEAMQNMMAQQMEAMGTEMSDEQMEAVMAVYDGLDLSYEIHFDGDTQLIRQTTAHFAYDLSGMGLGDVAIALNASATYSGQNDTTITAPEDAQIIPPEALLGGGMSSS